MIPSVVRSSLIPNVIPTALQQLSSERLFSCYASTQRYLTFRLIALGPPSERDRQGQIGRVPKPPPASRRAKRTLVPAAVAAAENVRGGLAQARPSGFLIPARSVMASSVPTPATSTLTKPLPDFTLPLRASFPSQIARGVTKGGLRKMGRHQTEPAYLNQCCFGCKGIGLNQTHRGSIGLRRSSRVRGTILFGGIGVTR
jgi:hypothetical protein